MSKAWLHTGVLLVAFTVSFIGCSEEGENNPGERQGRQIAFTDTVQFISKSGEEKASIGVAIADDDNERSLGLMDVNELAPDKGMLFIFPDEQPRSFWMANTPLPLDIIYINADREIVRIHRNTQPFSEENFPSGDPAKYVVEVNAGYCVSHDIQEGMLTRIRD